MNSFTNIKKAVTFEMNRQIDLIESGEKVIQETRRFNDSLGVTEAMRGKEDAHDYRYFREPDLVEIYITREEVEKLRDNLPELAGEKLKKYVECFGLNEADARLLVKYYNVAKFFEDSSKGTKAYRDCCNLIIGLIFSKFESEEEKEKFEIKVNSSEMNELLKLLESRKIKNNLAKKTLDEMLLTGKKVNEILSEEDLKGLTKEELLNYCKEALNANEKAVSDYRNGKQKALKSLVGFVMKQTKGKADAVLAEEILVKLLAE